MGLFDWVEFKYKCPICGAEIGEWQSKDGECYLNVIKDFRDVNEFHDICKRCNTWLSFRRKKATSIEDYDLVTESLDRKGAAQ